MDDRRLLRSGTTLLSWLRRSRWLLLSFVLGGFFAASFSRAGDRPVAADVSKITLQRSVCYGTCPNYKVTIYRNGRVVFTTDTVPAVPAFEIAHGVILPGTHEDRISPGTAAALFKWFRQAGFFDLHSSYRVAGLDLPTYVLTVDTGRRHKSVDDYWGQRAGMPAIVTELENAVDELAGTDRWVRGTARLTPWLEGQHFDFHSPEAAKLAVLGANRAADEAMVLALIDRGAPLDSEVSNPKSPSYPGHEAPVIVAGFSLMEGAIEHGRARLFNELVAAGWLDRMGKERTALLFGVSAAGCSPELADAAADAGVDIDKPDPQDKTALANLTTSRRCRNREADRIATAQRLLARGANPNHRDNSGHTPLYEVTNPDMVNLLQAHGAERR
jgi:hypothetical protein